MRMHGLKVLGLALMAALGLMALSAGAAQAEEYFKILGTKVTTLTKVTGQQETGTTGLLLAPAASQNLDIHCPQVHVLIGEINANGHGLAKLLYLNCTSTNHTTHAALPACTPKSGGVNGDVTALVLFLVKLNAGLAYILAEPDKELNANEPFTTLEFTGACAIPNGTQVKGSVALDSATLEALKQLLLVASAAVQTALGDKLELGTKEVFLDGTAEVELVGSDCTWGWF